MNALQVILLSAAIAGGAILLYDQVAGGPAAPEPGELLEPSVAQLDGDGLKRQLAKQQRLLRRLESELAALQGELVRVREAAAATTKAERPAPPDPDAPLDEDELDLLRHQLDELSRRRERERQAKLVERQLEQLGVTFSPAEHAALQKRLVEFNVAVAAFWTRVRAEAISDQDEIASAYRALESRAEVDVKRLLSAEQAERVIMGFLQAGPKGTPKAPR